MIHPNITYEVAYSDFDMKANQVDFYIGTQRLLHNLHDQVCNNALNYLKPISKMKYITNTKNE